VTDHHSHHDTSTDVLLVEDNPHDAELTMRALNNKRLANHIVWVKDGVEALARIFGPGSDAASQVVCRPRVVLLDIKMPRMDGLEVLKRLKTNPLTRTIPVIIMTSSSEEGDLVRSYELGANSYVVKPVDFQSFSDAVQDVGLYWLLLNQVPEVK